ncbi:MAG: type II secretion system GspH family protein [Porticoccaceae bacterium]|nr:type II secretion system GspH family protein [Porticoccaceae bacterium]
MYKPKPLTGQFNQRGFSLLEMAVVLVVIGLILGGLLMPLSTQLEKQDRQETEQSLAQIHESIIGFAMANGRLPCPDSTPPPPNRDGVEDACGTGFGVDGNIPWVTLGIGQHDAWGQAFTYRVTGAFADCNPGCGATGVSFDLAAAGDINVLDSAFPAGALVASQVPAVVISHGQNWASMTNAAAAGADQWENRTNDTNFVDRIYSKTSTPGNPVFDDQIIWVSPNILKARMVAAGELP